MRSMKKGRSSMEINALGSKGTAEFAAVEKASDKSVAAWVKCRYVWK
jgi:hypothetical protein